MKKRFLALVMSLVMAISVATTAYATEVENEESNSTIELSTIEETSTTETGTTETGIYSGVELSPSNNEPETPTVNEPETEEVKSVDVSVRISGDDLSDDGYSTTDYLIPSTVTVSVQPDSAETVMGISKVGIDKVSAMDALVEGVYYSIYDEDMDPSTISDEDISAVKELLGETTYNWINGLCGLDNGDDFSWMYVIGDSAPTKGAGDQAITDGDNLWFFYSDYTYAYRGHFDSDSYSMKDSEEKTINLYAVPVLSEMYGTTMRKTFAGATVKVGDNTFTTDDKGNVTVSGLSEGTYNLSASWEDDEIGWYLVSPFATLTVSHDSSVVPTLDPDPVVPTPDPDPVVPTPDPDHVKPDPGIDTEKPESIVNIYNAMKGVYSEKTVSNSSDEDVNVFWDMLAKSSLTGIQKIDNLTVPTDLTKIEAQKVAKYIIACANNNVDSKELCKTLVSWQCGDGSFTNPNILNKRTGKPNTAQGSEQVWCMMALEIADYPYNQDKAVEYLMSKQNPDKGIGYKEFSDVGTTSWVINLFSLMSGDYTEEIDSLLIYISNQYEGLLSANDSSSVSAFVSSMRATDAQVKDLAKFYNESGKYFIWGTEDSSKNDYATSTCSQALGDYMNGQSIYKTLDDAYTVDSSVDPTPTPDPVKPEPSKPDPVVPTPDPVKPNPIPDSKPIHKPSNPQTGASTPSKGITVKSWDVKGVVIPFGDVKESWSTEAIKFCYVNGFMVGNGNLFNPKSELTRAQFVQIMYNLFGEKTSGTCKLTDINLYDWYYDAVNWAVANGVVGGYSDGTFGANDKITRQDMVAIMGRYLKLTGKTNNFTDKESISDYAVAYVNFFSSNGIICGYSDNTFGPKDYTTREQCSVIIYRLAKFLSSGKAA